MLTSKDLITESYHLYKANLKSLGRFMLLLGLLIFTEALSSVRALDLFGTTTKGLVLAGLIQLPFGILSILLTAALVFLIHNAAEKKTITLRTAIMNAARRFFPLLGASIIVGALTVLGFLAFVAPGVYLWMAFAFTSFFVLLENQGIKESMRASRELSRGHFWNIFPRLLLPNLFWGLTVWLILNIISGAIALTGLENLARESAPWATALHLADAVLSAATNALFIPLFTIVVYLLYKDLKS